MLLLTAAAGAQAVSPPVFTQAGDVQADRAILWGRCNLERDALLIFEVSQQPDVAEAPSALTQRELQQAPGVRSMSVGADSDFTGQIELAGLAPGHRYHYRTSCAQVTGDGRLVPAGRALGAFDTAPAADAAFTQRFVWLADVAGQGWGRNPDLVIDPVFGGRLRGGYAAFEVIRRLAPDFAIFQGDMIYADVPAPASVELPAAAGGGVWRNVPAKDFVAVTLDEFRANWKYNLGDAWLRGFLSAVPVYVQWDDHEVQNNWYPGAMLEIAPSGELAADALAARARQALFEYNPIRGERIYRNVRRGRHLELFLLDERGYRDPNTRNADADGIEMLGAAQRQWLEESLAASTATWKVISTHDPLSIVTGDALDRDAWAQGEPAVLGRELQLAALLSFLRERDIGNVLYLTSDVHYSAVISYDPARAVFEDFEPFLEFVAGPLHAGAFGPADLDPSFGPRYEFVRAPQTEKLPQNTPPPRLQSFGEIEIDGKGTLTARLRDVNGSVLHERTLEPRLNRLPLP